MTKSTLVLPAADREQVPDRTCSIMALTVMYTGGLDPSAMNWALLATNGPHDTYVAIREHNVAL